MNHREALSYNIHRIVRTGVPPYGLLSEFEDAPLKCHNLISGARVPC